MLSVGLAGRLAASVRLSDFHPGLLRGGKEKPMDHIELGQRLRASRERMGMSQQEVADRLKLPRTAISLIESGQRQVSTIELTQMATLFRRSVSELLEPTAPEDEDYLVV